MEIYQRECSICGTKFETKYKRHNICSFDCRTEASREAARRSMRKRRHKKLSECDPCIVCGYKKTTDVHHEGDKTYVLCPNHHALITRNINTLAEVLASKVEPNRLSTGT